MDPPARARLRRGEPGPLVKAFLDLLFAPEGQAIIQAKGFIPTGK